MYVSIRIKGHLDPSWQEYLEGLEIVQETGGTTRLSGVLQDQSALYGVLNMMSRLNLTLLSLERSERAQKEDLMRTVISKDGTPIAFDQSGRGPALILVTGALTTRADWSSLSAHLAPHFSVFTYDRRGRGESGDMTPYAALREVEDIDALITEAGGLAFLYGHSSGAALAMEAAIELGDKVKKLAMYEAPYDNDPEAQRTWSTYIQQLTAALAANRRGDAVALFMQYVGTPPEQIEGMRRTPAWPALEAIAPTLAYDHTAILGQNRSVPIERATQVRVPTLVINGSAGFPFLYETTRTLSQAIPHAQFRTLEGQDHAVAGDVLAPVLIEFFCNVR